MVDETPSDSPPEKPFRSGADTVALTRNASLHSIGAGSVTQRSDTPHPLRAVDPAIFSNSDQPQPPRPAPFQPGGHIEPFPVAEGFQPGGFRPGAFQGVNVPIIGVESEAEVGALGVNEFKINGETPDIAHFVGHVTSRRTVIVRTVLNNQVAVQVTALSLLAALDLKIEALRAGGSNSEITEFDDLKRRVEEFLAANKTREEARIADSTLSIADGLRRYWTEKYENICDIGLLGVGLSFCATAGALGVSDTNILTVTALAGGTRVVDVVKAAADLVWGKRDKD
jgi:hypothetical protein